MGEPYNDAAKRKRGGIDHTMTQYTEPLVHPKEQRNTSPQKEAHRKQDADGEYGPDHASRDMSAMNLDIGVVNQDTEAATLTQEQDLTPTVRFWRRVIDFSSDLTPRTILPQCFVQTNTSVPITQLQLSICAVNMFCVDKKTGAQVPIRAHKVLLGSKEHPEYRYDLDIAFLTKWKLVRRACPLSPLCRLQSEPDMDVMVIRKDYIVHKVPNRAGGLTLVYPDTIKVSGRPWHVRYCVGEKVYCYAFLGDVPFRLAKRTLPVRNAPTDAVPDKSSTVLLIVEGAPENPLTSDAADREFCTTWGLEVPAGFFFPKVGFSLWSPPYGEVYRACRLKASTTGPGVYDVAGGEEVAVKVVRHQNSTVPGAELGWWLESYQRHDSALINHNVPAGATLTTAHLAPYFEEQSKRGRNENLVNEIETMAFVARAVNEAVDGVSQSSCPLWYRFLPHREVALSPDNLFIVTQYAPFGSLSFYIMRENARNPKLSERCVKHVLRHMLQALCFLHERGLAHQDISLENTVLLVPEIAAELRGRAREFLSEADFLRLEVVLIDMGHMGIHQRVADLSLQHSLLNTSNITVNTATTCESSTSDPTGGGLGLDCSAVHSRAGSMDSSNGMDVSAAETATPVSTRRFRLRAMPKFPLGKRQYQPPEICAALNPLPYAPGREYCGMSLDMFQLGVLGIYMLTGRPPYEQFDSPITEGGSMLRKELSWFMALEQGQLRNRPVTYRDAQDLVTVQPLHTKISPPGMALLEKLLKFNPEERISAKAALEDPWFST